MTRFAPKLLDNVWLATLVCFLLLSTSSAEFTSESSTVCDPHLSNIYLIPKFLVAGVIADPV